MENPFGPAMCWLLPALGIFGVWVTIYGCFESQVANKTRFLVLSLLCTWIPFAAAFYFIHKMIEEAGVGGAAATWTLFLSALVGTPLICLAFYFFVLRNKKVEVAE